MILAKPEEQEEATTSGIVLPQTAKKRPQTARVIAAGDLQNGKVSEGDLVVFASYSGTQIKLDDEEHLILDTDDLLGVVEE